MAKSSQSLPKRRRLGDLQADALMAQGIAENTSSPLVDGYQIESTIGRGGMGTVYLATQLGLDRLVAIKQMTIELQSDPVFLERLELEARTMAGLKHENIVTVHQFERTESGDPVIVMEYIEGGNLRDLLSAHPEGLPLEDATKLTRQIASALSAAHESGVIHRDLKPENVLIAEDGRACLTDFGLAVPVDQQSTRLTLSGTTVGTLDYIAPERFRSNEADARSDLYALGVILYEMLTGEVPRGSFDPPAKLRTEITPALNNACMRALRSQPQDRFPSLNEFAEALDGAPKSRLSRRWFLPAAGVAIAAGVWKWFPPSSKPDPTPFDPSKWFNAIKEARLDEDIICGGWERSGAYLVTDERISVLALNPSPATPYEIRTTFVRISGRHSIAIFLTLNDSVGTVDIDGWSAGYSGLQCIGPQDLRQPESNRFVFFIENGRRYQLLLQVYEDRVVILIDGQEMGTFETNGESLRITQPWRSKMGDRIPTLAIGSYESPTRFEKVEWRKIP